MINGFKDLSHDEIEKYKFDLSNFKIKFTQDIAKLKMDVDGNRLASLLREFGGIDFHTSDRLNSILNVSSNVLAIIDSFSFIFENSKFKEDFLLDSESGVLDAEFSSYFFINSRCVIDCFIYLYILCHFDKNVDFWNFKKLLIFAEFSNKNINLKSHMPISIEFLTGKANMDCICKNLNFLNEKIGYLKCEFFISDSLIKVNYFNKNKSQERSLDLVHVLSKNEDYFLGIFPNGEFKKSWDIKNFLSQYVHSIPFFFMSPYSKFSVFSEYTGAFSGSGIDLQANKFYYFKDKINECVSYIDIFSKNFYDLFSEFLLKNLSSDGRRVFMIHDFDDRISFD